MSQLHNTAFSRFVECSLRALSGWDAWERPPGRTRISACAWPCQGFDVGDLPVTTWEEAPVTLGNLVRTAQTLD